MCLKNIALKIIKFYKIWENKCRENFCLSGNSFKKFAATLINIDSTTLFLLGIILGILENPWIATSQGWIYDSHFQIWK